MSGYKFTIAQRFAVYTVHGGTCYLNGEPLFLKSMRIDHILPRSLKDDPERLYVISEEYGLPHNFELDSFENWLPTCDPCNSAKYKEPFRPTPIIQRYVDRARSGAAETKALAERIVTNQAISKALITLEMAFDQGRLDLSIIEPLIELYEQHQRRTRLREFRITPQCTILHELEGYRIVQTNYGVGYASNRSTADITFQCPHCGNFGPWSGAICLTCGQLIEDG